MVPVIPVILVIGRYIHIAQVLGNTHTHTHTHNLSMSVSHIRGTEMAHLLSTRQGHGPRIAMAYVPPEEMYSAHEVFDAHAPLRNTMNRQGEERYSNRHGQRLVAEAGRPEVTKELLVLKHVPTAWQMNDINVNTSLSEKNSISSMVIRIFINIVSDGRFSCSRPSRRCCSNSIISGLMLQESGRL